LGDERIDTLDTSVDKIVDVGIGLGLDRILTNDVAVCIYDAKNGVCSTKVNTN
jgi:hypothetical protein